jgi:hypothetical protein
MDSVKVIVRPHPFREERRVVDVPQGQNVETLLRLAGLPAKYARNVLVDGEPLRREAWPTTRPVAGQTVTAKASLLGAATNKNGPFRAFLAFITVGTSEVWRAAYKRTGFAPNSLFWQPDPPDFGGLPSTSDRGSRPFITGSKNEMRPYSPVPQIFGYRVRYRPPYAARPYSSWRGNKQHFHVLLTFGYGPLRVHSETHKLGDTPISAYGVTQLTAGATPTTQPAANMQVREGWNSDPTLAYYLDQVDEQGVNAELRREDGSGNRSPWSFRRTGIGLSRIGVEVFFPEGLIEFTSKGTAKLDVEIEVFYAPAGTAVPADGNLAANGWTPATGRGEDGMLNKFPGIKFKDDKRAAFATGIDWDVDPTTASLVGTAGQFDVAMRRKTTDRNKLEQMDKTVWSTLREFRLGNPINLTGLCTVSMDIVATGNLSGELDSYNAEVSWMGTYYNGSSWVTPVSTDTPTLATSGQPAAHYRAILQGSANKAAVADARMDLTTLATWATKCETAGLHNWAVFDTPGTVFERLQAVAGMGRASFTMREGKFSVVYDLEQPGTAIQHFTPRNYDNFQGSIVFQDVVHAMYVEYVETTNEAALSRIVVYDDGYNADGTGGKTAATKFETLTLIQCRSKDEAWKHGRRALAERRLRREKYMIDVDVENLIVSRGDPCVLAVEAIDEITGQGRVLTVTQSAGAAVSVTTDEILTLDSAASYTMRVRKSDGSSFDRALTTPGTSGEYSSFTFAVSIPAGDPQPVAGDLVLVRKTTQTYRRCVVTQIEHRAELSARVSLADEAPDVYTADTVSVANPATTAIPTTASPVENGTTTTGQIVVSAQPYHAPSPAIVVVVTTNKGGKKGGKK